MYLSTIPMDRGTKYDTFVTTNTYDKYEPMTTTLLQATDLGGGNNIQNLAGSCFLTPPPRLNHLTNLGQRCNGTS